MGSNTQQRGEERAFCYELRIAGLSIRKIAAVATGHFGYNIGSTKVHDLLSEETEQRVRPLREAFIDWEADRLDRVIERAFAIADKRHVATSGGTIVRDDDGNPLEDDGPTLQALDRIIRASESRRRLFGLDVPTKVDATVVETTQQDLELQQLIAEAKAKTAAEEAQLNRSAQ